MAEHFLHANGGGLILGADGAVSSDSFVDRDSTIEGRSFISYGSRIVKSAIKDSDISFANITESPVGNSKVSGATVRSSGLENVVIRGTVNRIAHVQDCLLSNRVVVEGCIVRGFALSGPFLVHTDWTHEPRHCLLELALDAHLGIIECGRPGYAHVGCKCRKISHWIEHKEDLRRYFKREKHWDGAEIDIIHELFQQWRSIRVAA